MDGFPASRLLKKSNRATVGAVYDRPQCGNRDMAVIDRPYSALILAYVLFSRRGIWADFGFALCVFQISELRGHSAGDRCGLAAGLETCEVGAIAPGNRSAQSLVGRESCIMHNVDQPLIIRFALSIA